MYYRFSNNYIKRKTAKVMLTSFDGIDENVINTSLPAKRVNKMLGYRVKDGRLIRGLGVSRLMDDSGKIYPNLFSEVMNIYSMDVDGNVQVLACADKLVYIYNEKENKWKMSTEAVITGQDAVLFSSKGEPSLIFPKDERGLYRYTGYGFIDMKLPYRPITMCAHMNRLFLVDKDDEYRIRFSNVDDPYNFNVSLDEGGEIYMGNEDGAILKMISYNGNLYIFREYAIYRLTAFVDQREFVMRKIATTSSKILGGSIALCNDKILFVAEDGMYAFDTYAIKRIMLNIDITTKNMRGAIASTYYNGKYYVAYSNQSDTNNDRLMEIDLSDGNVAISEGLDVRKFVIVRSKKRGEKLAVTLGTENVIGIVDDSSERLGESLTKIWSVQNVDFDIRDKEKTVSSVIVRPHEHYYLTITCDDGKKMRCHIDGEHRKYTINLRGYSFDFEIDSDGNTPITPPVIEIKV